MSHAVIVGKKLKWADIKIGQAFYFVGCHGFAVKNSETTGFVIDTDWYPALIIGSTIRMFVLNNFYALPKSIRQDLEPL